MGQCQHLMSSQLNCPGLVDADVSGSGCNYTFIGVQESAYDSGVGLGAAYEKMYFGIRTAAGCADFFTG